LVWKPARKGPLVRALAPLLGGEVVGTASLLLGAITGPRHVENIVSFLVSARNTFGPAYGVRGRASGGTVAASNEAGIGLIRATAARYGRRGRTSIVWVGRIRRAGSSPVRQGRNRDSAALMPIP
jgi:hypothetical protein